MFKADVILKIEYDFIFPYMSVIRTNIEEEKIAELLEYWLMTQFGKGDDEKEINKKAKYEIIIKLDLNDDVFQIESDTGNKGLTCGIVMHVLRVWKSLKITGLSQTEEGQ